MKMRLLIVCLILTVFTGCTTSTTTVTKSAFRYYYISVDYFAIMKKQPEKEHWGNCLDISDEKLRMEINTIYFECIEMVLQEMPSRITANDERIFANSIDKCAKTKFYSKHKDKFTFDKSPQYLDHCKEIFKFISTLK